MRLSYLVLRVAGHLGKRMKVSFARVGRVCLQLTSRVVFFRLGRHVLSLPLAIRAPWCFQLYRQSGAGDAVFLVPACARR